MLSRYSRWDGTQQPFGLDPEELFEALAEDLLDDGDVWSALQRLFRQGAQGREGQRIPGLQDLLEQLRAQRRQRLDRHSLADIVKDLQERLDRVVQTERAGIQRRLEEGQRKVAAGEVPPALQKTLERLAGQKLQQLDQLPPSLPGAIKELQDYDFMDPEARRQFQELLELLQRQLLQSQFQSLQSALQGLRPEDLQRTREMVRDLNRMLRDRRAGREPDFDRFMQKHGQFFPGVQNLDQLVEQLQRQIAQVQSLLDSLTPEQRRQLQQLMENLLRDDRLRQDLAELGQHLEALYPSHDFRRRYPFRGDDAVTLEEAMELMDELQQLDQLERQLRGARSGEDLQQVDADQVRDLLGDEAAATLEQLRQLTRLLEGAGFIERRGDRYELTPQAIRKIGQKALRDLFDHLKRDRFGKHPTELQGIGGERTDDTKRYEFGDPFQLDVERTVRNAVVRQGAGTPVRLAPDDFEVYRSELLTQCSTVLMLDMSRSMILRGCFLAAKKVALALNTLIKAQYPRDSLYVVGFSYLAKELPPETLPTLTWNEWVYGTNLQHGLMLARQLLAKHKGGNKQIVLITDGEPTVHFEGGHPEFNYPPTPRTLLETLKEVQRCTRERIVVNTFMLEESYGLRAFVEQMTRLNRGRAFFVTPDRLGEYILVDYVRQKRRVVT